mgnify:CR=1 FL=1
MADIVIAQDAWDEDIEGSLLTWIYPDGSDVKAGDIIAEITVEKLQVDIAAPADGVLSHAVSEGDLVSKGGRIGSLA